MSQKLQIVISRLLWFAAGFLLAKQLDGVGVQRSAIQEEARVSSEVGQENTFLRTIGIDLAAVAARSSGADAEDDKVRVPAPVEAVEALEEAEQEETSKEEAAKGANETSVYGGEATAVTGTMFDHIVHTAYRMAAKDLKPEKALKRNKFDIDYWENKSGLTTQGGLRTRDRILLAELYSDANSVFEFGLGESTYMANYLGVPRYAGIDSDPVWVDLARQKVSGHYRFYFGDMGNTRAWGYPTDLTLTKNILDYQLEGLIVEQEPFDVYMVDGRFRLACALVSFLHASARGGDTSKTTVLIHDCPKVAGGRTSGVDRNVYKKGEELLDLVNHSDDRLCVYQRKPETTDVQLMELWKEYANEIKRR